MLTAIANRKTVFEVQIFCRNRFAIQNISRRNIFTCINSERVTPHRIYSPASERCRLHEVVFYISGYVPCVAVDCLRGQTKRADQRLWHQIDNERNALRVAARSYLSITSAFFAFNKYLAGKSDTWALFFAVRESLFYCQIFRLFNFRCRPSQHATKIF